MQKSSDDPNAIAAIQCDSAVNYNSRWTIANITYRAADIIRAENSFFGALCPSDKMPVLLTVDPYLKMPATKK